MDNDQDHGNGGGAANFVTKNDLKEFKGNHDENCKLKLGSIDEKISMMESRIKFAIYMSTGVVGIVLLVVNYYLLIVAKGS